jgi:coenzyme PQQ precursor peptide PqqA
VLLPQPVKCGPFNPQSGIKGQFLAFGVCFCHVEVNMAWTAPKILEISCGMEINRYAPADDTDPVQF